MTRTFLVAQMVKNLHAKLETWVPSLGQEDPLEKEMATHSSILFWKTPWTEELGWLQSMGSQRVRHRSKRLTHTYRHTCIYIWRSPWTEELGGLPVYGIAKSQTTERLTLSLSLIYIHISQLWLFCPNMILVFLPSF